MVAQVWHCCCVVPQYVTQVAKVCVQHPPDPVMGAGVGWIGDDVGMTVDLTGEGVGF